MNLLQLLSTVAPKWQTEISSDPLEAAYELGLIEDDTGNPPDIDFSDPATVAAARDFYRDYMQEKEDE